MITDEMVTPVGKTLKPHGYKGDLKFDAYFESAVYSHPHIPFFAKIDNILVPFFVETIGGGSEGTTFIKFKDIDSDLDALMLAKKEIYALKSFLTDELGVTEEELEQAGEDVTGFRVVELEGERVLGVVDHMEEGVEYDYMAVRKTGEEALIYIPFIDEFVEEITEDEEGNGEIKVVLPDGFLEI